MVDLVRGALADPDFLAFAHEVTRSAGKRDTLEVPYQVVNFVRGAWVYRRDPVGVELIKTPSRALKEYRVFNTIVGDCDDASLFAGSLLVALGYPIRFVVMQSKPEAGKFDHIFFEVLAGQEWKAIDGIAFGRDPFFRPQGVRYKTYPV